jgi:hypothetical protein
MIRWLRDAFGGGTKREAADAAVGRGMADVLAALDNVIDDDAALGRICAGPGETMPGETMPGETMPGEPLREPLRAVNPLRAADRRYLP